MDTQSDLVIVGGGLAGLTAARLAVLNGLSYTILESNSPEWLGGRVHTEPIDLTQFQTSNCLLPSTYKFEHGGAWLHGLENSVTLDLLNSLHYEHYPELGKDYITKTQLFEVFQGCSWLLPEFIPYDQIVLLDPSTESMMTSFQYTLYLAITVIHLRHILRQYPGLPLNRFAQTYVNWIETTLPRFRLSLPSSPSSQLDSASRDTDSARQQTLSELDSHFGGICEKNKSQLNDTNIAGLLARAVGWYFHSVEGYHGIPIGEMHNQYLFYPLTDKVYGDIAVFDENIDIMETILNDDAEKELFAILAKWIGVVQQQEQQQQQNKKQAPSNSQQCDLDISHDLIQLYRDSKYLSLDTETHGCYIGPHCVLTCGMSKLVQLLVLDIEQKSQKPLNIRYHHHVTALGQAQIDGNSDETQHKYNTVICEVRDQKHQCKNETQFLANKAVILTGSIPSLTNSIQLKPSLPLANECLPADQNTPPLIEIFSTLGKSTQSVFYKKVSHCFGTAWWPRADTARVVGIFQSYTDMTRVESHDGVVEEDSEEGKKGRDFSQGQNGYHNLVTSFSPSALSDHDQSKLLLPNLLFESHQPSKGVPVLSASIVGNLAEALTFGMARSRHSAEDQNCSATNSAVATRLTLTALDLLHNHLTQQKLPDPLFSRVTQWGESPTFKHSYSFVDDPTLGTASRITIAAQHGIFFSGEGIDVYDTGSIHAAITTSERAIKFIIDGVVEMVEDEEDEDCEWTAVVDDEDN